MTRPTIDQIVTTVQDYAVVFRWDCTIVPPAGVGMSAQALNAHAISSDYPKFQQEEIEVTVHGFKTYQAGIRTYDPVTLTFVEDEKGSIQNFIKDYSNILWTAQAGTQQPKLSYTCSSVYLRPLKADNTQIHSYNLKYAWMQTFDMGKANGGENNVIMPTITFRYDYFLHE